MRDTHLSRSGRHRGRWRVPALVAAMLVAACSGRASAQPALVELSMTDRDTGQVLPMYAHAGKLYVAGQAGVRYSLKVHNQTGGRVMVVVSVDGLTSSPPSALRAAACAGRGDSGGDGVVERAHTHTVASVGSCFTPLLKSEWVNPDKVLRLVGVKGGHSPA